MKGTKESIIFMQNSLNRLMQTGKGTDTHANGVYALSLMLDKEIVKYYKSHKERAC